MSPKQRPDQAERLREEGRQIGLSEGRIEGYQAVLQWLEVQYLKAPNRPDRDSPQAEAVLELARSAGKHLRKLLKKEERRLR